MNVRSPGLAMSDYNIFLSIADAWGCGHSFTQWSTPEKAFQLLTKITKDQPCDISGIKNYDMIESFGGIQWPLSKSMFENYQSTTNSKDWIAAHQERRLFANGSYFTPDERARLFFDSPTNVTEPTNTEYPFALLTGRGSSSQWHTNTRTSKSPVLRALYPAEAYIEIHPSDAHKYQIRDEEEVEVRSRRGNVTVKARIVRTVQMGTLFMPMHYQEANALTLASFDSYSRQSSYKHCAVSISHLR